MLNLLQELKSRPGDRPELALRLWFGSLALLVVFAATVFNAALPLQVVDPRWLQGLIQALLSWGFLPLIALVLLQLAAVLNPESSRLRRRRDRFSRLALVAALGFALLIPLQLISTWGSLNQQASGQNKQRLQGLAVIGQLRQAISAATSHQDLASRLAALPIPQSGSSSPADLALPFPQRQRNLLEGLARSEAQLTNAASTAAPIPWPGLIEAALRVIPTALALAGGFFVLGYGSRGGRKAGR
ncbi:hypothetical protein LBMAG41_26600 [Cyanobium sp.]|nr:hypothetical protein LBMAG41_26600 [Cyanobium sp.]